MSEEKALDGGNAESQRSILITGAASGIGCATARLFARRGWFVGCLDMNRGGLVALQDDLGSVKGFFRALDVTDREALLSALAEFGTAAGGRLDLLFNNAGIDAKGRFETMPWETVVTVVNVNLVAGLSLIHGAIPLLRATKGSLCLSTASASAIFGTANLAVYSATKHAIKGLTEALSVELAEHGVRCADILPGIVDTGMLTPRQKASLPKEGMLRVLPAEAVADTVWEAYQGNNVHWYVPSELRGYDIEVTTRPEAARDRRIAGSY